MRIDELTEKFQSIRLIPVVKLDRADDALHLAEALNEGGLPAAEITFRTDAAEESIRSIKKNNPGMIVGAGTVINVEQAKRAIGAGAEFLVSPGLSGNIVKYAQEQSVPIIPGCCTPTEIMQAIDYGLNILKFFPANLFGGVAGIKSLAPVFPGIRFMPTGGVNIDNIMDFLSYDRIIAVGGSWFVKDSLITSGNFGTIAKLTREAVDKIKILKK
jgi:2-dehydro-3-deoxyphosphogluconate aldolase/(4S)-4-hydroxy-2-oxoglutarate aldolase